MPCSTPTASRAQGEGKERPEGADALHYAPAVPALFCSAGTSEGQGAHAPGTSRDKERAAGETYL